jgi:hypothetical protein
LGLVVEPVVEDLAEEPVVEDLAEEPVVEDLGGSAPTQLWLSMKKAD